jgi:hypothetical protein
MEPLDVGQLASSIAQVRVTDLDTGEVRELATRPRSACHFFEPFETGSYVVQLRLDWTDIDSNGHPRLDADFLDPTTGKHWRSMRAHSAHHTDSAAPGDRTYRWEFEDVELRLKALVCWLSSATCRATASVTCTATVIRATHGDLPACGDKRVNLTRSRQRTLRHSGLVQKAPRH